MTTAAITAGRVDTIASTVAERDWQIDVAKALAIILVALGHASGMPPAYKLFAYSFHVPLFFVLSGWVGERFGRRAFGRKTVGKLARTLLIPYVSFFLVAYGYWILSAVLNGTSQSWAGHPWWHPFVGLLWANGSSLYVLPALWFLPALFVATVVYLALREDLSAAVLAVCSLLVVWAWTRWFPGLRLRLPFALDVLPVALFFIAVGAWLSRFAERVRALPAVVWVVAFPVLAFAWGGVAAMNGQVDVNNLQFGKSSLLVLIASLLGTAMTLCIAYFMQGWRWLRWIGANTLLILGTHTLVFLVVTSVVVRTGVIDRKLIGTPVWALALCAFAIAACIPMRAVLVRAAPWMLGLKRK